MGNREALLAGAKKCLFEKGYAKTTARDIAAAAKVSLAAIGYHFGSKEDLLNEALLAAVTEWSEDLSRTLRSATFDEAWTEVVRSFSDNHRLWAVQFELLAHLDQKPELKATFADANRKAREGLVALFGGPAETPALGAVYQALIAGLAAQWLVDPESTPTGTELREALAAIT